MILGGPHPVPRSPSSSSHTQAQLRSKDVRPKAAVYPQAKTSRPHQRVQTRLKHVYSRAGVSGPAVTSSTPEMIPRVPSAISRHHLAHLCPKIMSNLPPKSWAHACRPLIARTLPSGLAATPIEEALSFSSHREAASTPQNARLVKAGQSRHKGSRVKRDQSPAHSRSLRVRFYPTEAEASSEQSSERFPLKAFSSSPGHPPKHTSEAHAQRHGTLRK